MVVDARTDLATQLTAQQLNAALIERHQSGSLALLEAFPPPGTPGRMAAPPVPPMPSAAPPTIAVLHERTDAERALAWQYTELERQRAENAAILDAADEAMVLISADHRLTNANRRFCELLGSSRERLLGLHVHQIRPILLTVFGTDEFCTLLRWKPEVSPRGTIQIEQTWPVRSTHALTMTDVEGHDAARHGRLFSLRDITHQLELDRMKDEFVATVSHELRTPLTSIAGFLDLLMRGSAGQLPDQALEYLAIVQRNVSGLAGQVEELLEFSRLESGAFTLSLDRVDLNATISEAVATVSPMVTSRQHRLTVDLPGSLPAVHADHGRVVQVLVNLLSNANRYTLDGGAIAVHARRDDRFVRVDVVDSGIGLTPREQDLVFTRFYRVRENAHPQIGSGLGLPISRSLIERMGGAIWVESTPSQGSTFSFTLPIAA